MHPQTIHLTDVDRFQPSGLPWKTVDQARWAYRMRNENGLAGAFVEIGKRKLINVAKFHELVAQRVA
jgi:hypothetical protein